MKRKALQPKMHHLAERLYPEKGASAGNTVGSKTLAMFGSCGLIAMQRLTAWEYRLALV